MAHHLNQQQWTEFLSCPICYQLIDELDHRPISLGCGHTICKSCLMSLPQKRCPFDQLPIQHDLEQLPINFALLQLVNLAVPEADKGKPATNTDVPGKYYQYYQSVEQSLEELTSMMGPATKGQDVASNFSKPMQRKLLALLNCQIMDEDGRVRAMRTARSVGERTVLELILQHQNSQQLSTNLWAAVRARGCQFLGPAMQEEVLKLILLALEDGSALSRKVLVLFVVQRLEAEYPQASKTAIGHVVQLLYRASCFKVNKRDGESSLMQLKEEVRRYEDLRREHDAQIVQIANEAGLRISPEQWSSLLYGDIGHKPHMQSIMDKLQTPSSFQQSINELVTALQRSGDQHNLLRFRAHFAQLANVDSLSENDLCNWELLDSILKCVIAVLEGLLENVAVTSSLNAEQYHSAQHNLKYKTSMCRDYNAKRKCPRGANCTFAHSTEELEMYRSRSRRQNYVPSQAFSESPVAPLNTRASLDSQSPEPQSPNTDTVATYNYRRGINIPTMKASNFPMSAKVGVMRQVIYTSPTQTKSESQPNILPTALKVPSANNESPEQDVQNPKIILVKSTSDSCCVKTNTKESFHSPQSQMSSIGNPFQHQVHQAVVHGVPLVQPSRMQSEMSMPANPYTKELLPSDTQYFLGTNVTMQTTGKTPSAQLDDLHQRRDQLLEKLGHKDSTLSLPTSGSLAMSLADSMATSITTMTLKKNLGQNVVTSSSAYDVDGYSDSINNHAVSNPIEEEFFSSEQSNYQSHAHSSSDPSLYDLFVVPPQVSETTQMRSASASPTIFDICDLDEFIPMEHAVVSRYGPISRATVRTRTRQADPIAVTASQQKDTESVDALKAWNRPYPSATQAQGPVRSRPGSYNGEDAGLTIACSLPTALIQPTVAKNVQKPWDVRHRMMPRPDVVASTASGHIRDELNLINNKIENLKISEGKRLERELQSIELNIQETERQIRINERPSPNSHSMSALAAHLQIREANNQKQIQEQQDRKLAEEIVISEAWQKGIIQE